MKICYNGQLLEKVLPERMSKIFEKKKVLKTDSEKTYFIFDSKYDVGIIEAAIRFYEAPKPFSDDDLNLFKKYPKELYSLSKSLCLPSLQNFSHAQLKPQSFDHVSTSIEDDIIVFGEQDFNNYYQYKKSSFPPFPTFKIPAKKKGKSRDEDKFAQLYKKYQDLQKQINTLEEDLQKRKKKLESQEDSKAVIDQPNEEPSDDKSLATKKSQQTKAKKTPKKTNTKKKEYSSSSDDDSQNLIENEEVESNISGNQLDKYVIETYNKLKFKESRVKNAKYAYSSSISEDCEKVDILANTDGWFYQSAEEECQFVMFKFDSPVIIDYYFMMTYALPKGFAHLKEWRLATLQKKDDKNFVVVNLDQRDTMDLDGPNKMVGFEVNFGQPVDNVFIQITGKNVFDNYRLTLQNIFFSSNPPLDYESPFYPQ